MFKTKALLNVLSKFSQSQLNAVLAVVAFLGATVPPGS